MKSFEIGGRKFNQGELRLIQWRQLSALLKKMAVPLNLEALNVESFLDIFHGEELSRFMAIVLTEEGSTLREKNLEELAEHFDYEASILDPIRVVADFFDVNPTASILRSLAELTGTMRNKVTEIKERHPESGSTTSS